jgi:hypothetical protein
MTPLRLSLRQIPAPVDLGKAGSFPLMRFADLPSECGLDLAPAATMNTISFARN